MRKKNIIFGVIGFVLAVVMGGHAFAALGPGEISMGVFSIPLPADGKDACRVWLDKQTDSTLTCDDFFASLKGDPGSPGDNACYPVYSYTGWETSSFQLNIKWCCGSGAVDCQEMTNSYPVENAYTNYYNAWLAQYCSVVFDTTPIENGYQVISKNPCTGEEETYNITGEVGQSANIVSVTPSYTPYPQSTNDGTNPEKQGYMTLTIEYISGPNSVHTTPDPCEIHVKQYTSGEHVGEYYNVKVCHDAQGSSLAGSEPVYAKGGSYEFAYNTPDGTLGLADVANKIPLTTENKYKGPDISNRKIGYKYVLETYPDGTTRETNKEFDQPEEVIEYVTNDGVVTTNTGKRYTCGGKDTNTVCTNSGVKYCFELSASTGSVCNDAISVGVALDNEFNGTTGDYLYHGPDVSAETKGYLYKVLTHGSGRVEEVDKKEDECDPVVGTTSAADSTLKTGQRCKCGGMTSSAPCNVANGTYLLGVYGGAQDLLSVMQNQVQVKIKMFGTTLYYCSGSATCCDANQTPGEGDFATCWTSVNIAGLHGDNGASCLATKSGSDWYICCSPSYTGDDCNKVIDDDIIAMLNGMMCQVNYTHKYLHDDGNGGFMANTTKDGARGERVIVTNSCNADTENLDTYYGEDGPAGDDYDPCDGLSDTEALSTVSRRTTVYVRHGSTDSSTTTTGIGYYTETNVMCDTSNKIVKKYDKCDPVSLASGASRTVGGKTCLGNQTLLMCTPQEEPTTPYYVCSDAEVSDYPKKKYFAPTVSDGKITKEGYTALVHKYTSSGNEVSETNGITLDKCDPAIKKSRNANDTATVVKTVSKCTVQYPGTTGYNVGSTYCLNLDSGESCDDYLIIGEEEETYSTQYISPTGTSGKLTVAGYTCRKKTFTRKTTSGSTVSTVEEECQKIQDDTCHKAVKHTRTSSDNIITMAEKSLLKCEVQAPGNTSYTKGTYYCLNLGNGENCNDYVITGNESEQSHDEYVAPTMSNGVPTTVGYLRTSVTNSRLAAGSQTYYTNERKDPGRKVYKGSNSTVKYTVQAPGAESGTFVTGTEYCIGISIEACAEYRDDNPCAGVDTAKESTTVQKVIDRTYTRTENSQGSMVSTYKMCDDSTHTESTADECKEVPTPAGQTCANGVWMQCTRQADENATATRGTTYGYCATYPQCVGNPSSSVIVKKTQRSYTAPTKTNSGNSYYTTPGKVTDVKIACNDSTISTAESAEDQCEEIPDTNSICPTNKVLKSCKRKGDESSTLKAESTYNLCTAGTSIFSAISENDPCDGDTTSDNAKKKVKSIQYEYVTPVSGTQSKRVGYSVKATTMCNPEGNTTEYIYDTCEPLAASDNCKSGTTYKPYYKCHKQMYDATSANASNREYNACDPLPAAVALSSAVANKLDSDVEFKIKPNDQDGNKDYITITGSNMTDKPVVALESLQGASALELWKEQQTDNTTCQKLFSKNCNALGLTEFMQDISDYGTWAREELQDNPNASANDLSRSSYRATLQPCQGGFSITEDDTYSGADGKRYTMTCND